MCEDAPCCGCCGPETESSFEDGWENGLKGWDEPEMYDGPGSGEDDFADYNANEADDYRDE